MTTLPEGLGFDNGSEKSGVWHRFFDLDDPNNVDGLIEKAHDSATTNFMINFSENIAVCAFDIPVLSIGSILDTNKLDVKENGDSCTRWINVWSPYRQRPLLELFAERFDFSPRLLALMCSNPHGSRRQFEPSSVDLESSWKPFWHRHAPSDEGDVEKGYNVDEISDDASISSANTTVHGNLYRIIDSIWHYCSVDFGPKYICIGFNSLYGTKASGDKSEDGPLPQCIRVWTWLLLCEDNTVISITEDPFPDMDVRNTQLSDIQQRILTETRRNLTNVFRSLSSVHADPLVTDSPLKLLPIRRGLNTASDEVTQTYDPPSLLFYYLFENWHNSYTLVTRRESRFGVELASLRAEMFTRPRLRHIDRLDRVGKELGVLRRHFEGHKRIIDRVTEPRGGLAVAAGAALGGVQTVHVVSEVSSHHRPSVDEDGVRSAVVVTARNDSASGITLTPAAKARFRRLRDLIDVYALSEVEEYIKQKEALVAMNFNLIAIKQSGDVERLTRITLLLTKVTILFTPVSLMTTYFSVQLENVSFTVPVYWISFTVVLVLSWLALVVLGVFSGSLQTLEVLRGTWIGLRRTFRYLTRG